jgi:leucyl aminopeptidase
MDENSLVSLSAARRSDWQGDLLIQPVVAKPNSPRNWPLSESGDMLLLDTHAEGRRLVIVLDQRGEVDDEALRRAGGLTARWLLKHGISRVGLEAGDLYPSGGQEAVYAYCEGLLLGEYRNSQYKSSRQQEQIRVELCLLDEGDLSPLEGTLLRCSHVCNGVNLARALANEPPNVINPHTLAARAVDLIAHTGLTCQVLDEKRLAEIGAGAILAVGQGSSTPPCMIVLEHPGRGAQAGSPPVVIVGKALTFDSGGYMLKDHASIVGMKYDKCGGAAVLGIMHAVSQLQPGTPVVGIVAAAENMISPQAYRPDDVIRTLSGTTVEITNPDAEGRLVLCDALTYAQRHYRPRALIDLATLTYGVVTALGRVRAGLMSNDSALAEALLASGERSGERLWRLPLDEEYLELLHSDIADLKNYSGTKEASPISGGLFLKQFVPDGLPWAHLDILGTATSDKDLPYAPKGATGFGVRLLLDYLSNLRG